MTSLKRIAVLETIAADALPCAVLERYDGWRLRFNHGVTRRANSVLAEAPGSVQVDDKLKVVEAFYQRHGAPPRFQLSAASRPSNLDSMLHQRGFAHEPGANIMVASSGAGQAPLAAPDSVDTPPLVQLRGGTIGRGAASSGGRSEVERTGFTPRCESIPFDTWLEILGAVDPGAASKAPSRSIALREAGQRVAHCLLEREGTPVAAGLAVAGRGHAGLFNMATHPNHRRMGAATALIRALARWAAAQGVHTLYLQVDERNVPAQRLYQRAGFRTLYRYHYRVRNA